MCLTALQGIPRQQMGRVQEASNTTDFLSTSLSDCAHSLGSLPVSHAAAAVFLHACRIKLGGASELQSHSRTGSCLSSQDLLAVLPRASSTGASVGAAAPPMLAAAALAAAQQPGA